MKKNSHDALFFSMTYEFLEIYLAKQLGRSPDTIESYRDALTLFRRYVRDEQHSSVTQYTTCLVQPRGSQHCH